MRHGYKPPRGAARLSPLALLVPLVLLGCSGLAAPQGDRLEVSVPCGMASPLLALKTQYEAQNPGLTIEMHFDRTDGLIERILRREGRSDVLLTTGPVEMEAAVRAGYVERADIVTIGQFQMALSTHVSRKGEIARIEDLAKPEVKKIVLPPTEMSSLSQQAQAALERLELWAAVKDKVVRLPVSKDCHTAVAAGKADASFGYLGCPIAIDGEKAGYSKVVAVQVLDDRLYGGAPALAAVLKGTRQRQAARAFLRFLGSPAAQAQLRRVGVMPVAHKE